MKAIVVKNFGDPSVLQMQEILKPKPQRKEVLIRIVSTSINFADIKMRKSLYRGKTPPFVPGFDGTGIVEELGEGIQHLFLGQRVACYFVDGSYAEFGIAKENLCYPLPDDVDDLTASGIGVFITAANALRWAGKLQKEEDILIHSGAGGVGSSAIQMAKSLGAKRIFTTVGKEHKISIAQDCGAEFVYLSSSESWEEEILQETGGKGVPLVLDTWGGSVLEKSFHCLAPMGRIVTFGHSSSTTANISSAHLHRNNQSVIGYSTGGYRKIAPSKLQETAQWVFQQIQAGQLRLVCGGKFSFENVDKAHQLLESKNSVGKIILTPLVELDSLDRK